MFDVRELRAEMARAGINQKELARYIGVSEQTLVRKMKTGSFSIPDAHKVVEALKCDPMRIFFAEEVTQKATD